MTGALACDGGLQIGDRVVIRKAGAIIPDIVRSITRKQRENELIAFHGNKDVNMPTEILDQLVASSLTQERPPFNLMAHIGGKCPSCGSTDSGRPIAGGATIKAWIGRCHRTISRRASR